jgi:transposase
MFGRGKRQVDVAAKLGISQPTASRWYQTWLTGGRAALAGAGRAGRMRKLSDEQLAKVEAALLEGPKANGYPTEMWTLARVAEVIEKVTRVRHGTPRPGPSCARGWAGASSGRRAVRWNATTKRSPPG